MKHRFLIYLFTLVSCVNCTGQEKSTATDKPNLIIIQTDEHNFRTLGAYREQLTHDQAFVWGDGVEVKTPHIDRLAHEGAICNNFYASSPVCTPSRASLMSGLYPIATGSPSNNMPMNDSVITFAQVLKNEGYATSYLGKWHLDGDAKPGFAPKRKFGFDNNKYMFNRGHWKGLTDDDNGNPKLLEKWDPSYESMKMDVSKTTNETFTTDYLTNKLLNILERDKDGPFCAMLSLPDPHTPNTVRAPYDSLYNHLQFKNPKTMDAPLENMPKYLNWRKKVVTELDQGKMQRYFGMVKCIDDNVGRILAFLEANGLEENTIVVFTSDHGDLMGEHKKHNKGSPFETSAKIPFLIRYPQKIMPKKVINKAFTTVDFAPTILSLMGMPQIPDSHGQNAAQDFLSKEQKITDDRITYVTNAGSQWITAVNNRYKLVLSIKDDPWLFDLQEDPDELINFYKDEKYAAVISKMQAELLRQMSFYKDPIAEKNLRF